MSAYLEEILAFSRSWAAEIAMVLLLAALLPLGRRVLFGFIHLILFLEGIRLLIQPGEVMKLITAEGTYDSIHLYLLRVIGISYLVQALTFVLIDRTGDENAIFAVMKGFTVNHVLSCIPSGYLWLYEPSSPVIKLHQQMTRFMFFARLLGCVGCLYFIIRARAPAVMVKKKKLPSRSVLLDYAFLLVSGLTLLILPRGNIYLAQYMGNRVLEIDFLHDYLARMSGAMFISFGLMSHHVTAIQNPSSKVKGCILYPHMMFYLSLVILNVTLSPDWTFSPSSWTPLAVKTVPNLCLSLNVYLAMSDNDTRSREKKYK